MYIERRNEQTRPEKWNEGKKRKQRRKSRDEKKKQITKQPHPFEKSIKLAVDQRKLANIQKPNGNQINECLFVCHWNESNSLRKVELFLASLFHFHSLALSCQVAASPLLLHCAYKFVFNQLTQSFRQFILHRHFFFYFMYAGFVNPPRQ